MLSEMGLPELLVVVFLGVLAVMYFLPTIIAVKRAKVNLLPIMAVNILLGWSVIGWIVALVWALSTQVVDAPAAPVAIAAPKVRLCAGCGKYSQHGTSFCPHCGQAA